jgi:hypothetical protein
VRAVRIDGRSVEGRGRERMSGIMNLHADNLRSIAKLVEEYQYFEKFSHYLGNDIALIVIEDLAIKPTKDYVGYDELYDYDNPGNIALFEKIRVSINDTCHDLLSDNTFVSAHSDYDEIFLRKVLVREIHSFVEYLNCLLQARKSSDRPQRIYDDYYGYEDLRLYADSITLEETIKAFLVYIFSEKQTAYFVADVKNLQVNNSLYMTNELSVEVVNSEEYVLIRTAPEWIKQFVRPLHSLIPIHRNSVLIKWKCKTKTFSDYLSRASGIGAFDIDNFPNKDIISEYEGHIRAVGSALHLSSESPAGVINYYYLYPCPTRHPEVFVAKPEYAVPIYFVNNPERNGSGNNSVEPEFFKTIYSSTRKLGADHWLIYAIEQYSKSINKLSVRDRIIDLFVALECMFLSDGQTELIYRLSLRISKFLQSSGMDCYPESRSVFDELKKLYQIRSDIVHGKTAIKKLDTKEKEDDVVRRLNKYVRDSLINWLRVLNDSNPNIIREDYLDDMIHKSKDDFSNVTPSDG